jgi:hypothetical protein
MSGFEDQKQLFHRHLPQVALKPIASSTYLNRSLNGLFGKDRSPSSISAKALCGAS